MGLCIQKASGFDSASYSYSLLFSSAGGAYLTDAVADLAIGTFVPSLQLGHTELD